MHFGVRCFDNKIDVKVYTKIVHRYKIKLVENRK